jgi:hypothetical protein
MSILICKGDKPLSGFYRFIHMLFNDALSINTYHLKDSRNAVLWPVYPTNATNVS